MYCSWNGPTVDVRWLARKHFGDFRQHHTRYGGSIIRAARGDDDFGTLVSVRWCGGDAFEVHVGGYCFEAEPLAEIIADKADLRRAIQNGTTGVWPSLAVQNIDGNGGE